MAVDWVPHPWLVRRVNSGATRAPTHCDNSAASAPNTKIPAAGATPVAHSLYIECEQAFGYYGRAMVTCQADGTWSEPSESCTPGEPILQ